MRRIAALLGHISTAVAPAALILLLLSCSSPEPTSPATTTTPALNQAPGISSIIAPQEVLPSTNSEIQSVASDPDNDPITYTWNASGGQIEGSGSIIKWIAPDIPGDYTLEVTASDGAGGEDRKTVIIKVGTKPNTPPTISFKITREDKSEVIVLPGTTDPVSVAQWKTVQIECIAQDAEEDNINFLWAASEGTIEGSGNLVKYIATTRGDCVVICTAVDSRGARTQASIYFYVPCCGQGSFGKSGL